MGKWSRESKRRRALQKLQRRQQLRKDASPPSTRALFPALSQSSYTYRSPSQFSWSDTDSCTESQQHLDQPEEVDYEVPSKKHKQWEEISQQIKELDDKDPHPLVVIDEGRRLQVHITGTDGSQSRGSGVLKVSTEEYFKQVHERETKSKLVIRTLRDRVEVLERDAVEKERLFQIEKEEAVGRVRMFRRNKLIEGESRGGKMVHTAVNLKRK